MTEQSLKDKTAKGLFWGGVSNGLQLAIGIILARVLEVEDYGLMGMLVIFISISSAIMDSGFTNALINRKNAGHTDYNSVFWFSTFGGIILYLLLFFAAPLISDFYGNEKLTDLSRLLFLCILVGGPGIVHNAILLKEMRIKEKAKIDTISLAVAGIIGVFAALSGFSYWALAIQSVTYSFLLTALRWYFIKWRPTFDFHPAPIKEMIGFSSKIFITTVFQHVSNNLFSVILGRFYHEKEVGNYSQGQKWMTMGQSLIGGAVQNIAQPVLAQVAEERERQKYVFRKILRFGAFISFPLMFGLAFIGNEFIIITIGEKWVDAIPFLQLFCMWGAFSYIWTLYVNLLIAHGKSDYYLYGMILTTVAQLLVVLLIYPYGIYAMVVAYLSIYFIALLGWNYSVRKLIGLKYVELIKDISPFLIVTVLSLFAVWLITKTISNLYLLLVVKILFVGGLYVLIMWKSNAVVFKESVDFLLKKKR